LLLPTLVDSANSKPDFSFGAVITGQQPIQHLENHLEAFIRLFSQFLSCFNSSLTEIMCRIFVNVRMIWMLTWIALLLFKMPDNMATPCSVKAMGL
jgi:hypothetical protein